MELNPEKVVERMNKQIKVRIMLNYILKHWVYLYSIYPTTEWKLCPFLYYRNKCINKNK